MTMRLLNFVNLLPTDQIHKYLNIKKILFKSKLWLWRILTFIVAHGYEIPYRNKKRVLGMNCNGNINDITCMNFIDNQNGIGYLIYI